MISAFATTCGIALKSNRVPTFNFLGLVTFGIMGLLLIIFFVDQVIDYWLEEFFYTLFNDITTPTPFLNWFFGNVGVISIIWFAILLLLNQLQIDLSELVRRREREGDDVIGNRRIEP
jgi:hypothetical protein